MNYDNTMVIVANLGELKVYNVKRSEGIVNNEIKVSYSLEALNDISYIMAHQRLQDTVTDNAGRFGSSTGENHNLASEMKRRSVQEVAEDINKVIANEAPRKLLLAFPQEFSAQLMDALSDQTKNVLTKNIGSDLVKIKKEEILGHF